MCWFRTTRDRRPRDMGDTMTSDQLRDPRMLFPDGTRLVRTYTGLSLIILGCGGTIRR